MSTFTRPVSTRRGRSISSAASAEDRRSVLVSLQAEVARNYIDLRRIQKQIGTARDNIASQQETLGLTRARFTAGLSSDLFRRRPDIRRAERQLAAATARIGVAMADLFPRFSLTGSFGLQSAALSDLPEGGSRFFSIGPSLRWPIFSGGRVRANIAVQNAREEALVAYEQTLVLSLEEVENALVAYAREQNRRDFLREAVAANRRAVEIANELFIRGLANFLDVLESQRSLFASESALDESEAAASADLVALYKALGGGWEVADSDRPIEEQAKNLN